MQIELKSYADRKDFLSVFDDGTFAWEIGVHNKPPPGVNRFAEVLVSLDREYAEKLRDALIQLLR